ncbi:hypothetical protein PPYR_13580 [Photinus pyralis]|uniref:Uncharacterized protein n=2 Tax=Photinus pyralis TaxID=7054 RepID=A0A5N4A9F6_PHOPY|nr:uncharacterized protein LOC116179740 [Photinus pyralis]XP_031355426.1 uncharacterized protein LOC116179746 [Photinus pyralis]KAB0793960.1 hypothetical protein PPYR_13580 [Photinus pyralis]
MKVAVLVCVILTLFQVSCRRLNYVAEDFICMKKLGIEESYLNDRVGDNFLLTTGDDQFNDFVVCWVKEMGLVDENMQIIPSELKSYILKHQFNLFKKNDYPNKDEVAERVSKSCLNTQPGKNDGDTMVNIFNCVMTQMGAL